MPTPARTLSGLLNRPSLPVAIFVVTLLGTALLVGHSALEYTRERSALALAWSTCTCCDHDER